MAIIEVIPGLEVAILVKNTPAKEYENIEDEESDFKTNKDSPTKQVTRYIESLTNKEFQICIKAKRDYRFSHDALRIDFTADGVPMAFFEVLWKPDRPQNTTLVVKGVPVGDWARGHGGRKAFKFTKIDTVSDTTASHKTTEEETLLRKMGQISVEVYEARRERNVPISTNFENAMLNAPSLMHEKDMKGDEKSHGVSLGTVRPTGKKMRRRGDYARRVTDKMSPMAVYIFKYRSKERLQQLQILPRDPEYNGTHGLNALKKEKAPGFPRARGIKHEGSEPATSLQSFNMSDIEVIDLVDD